MSAYFVVELEIRSSVRLASKSCRRVRLWRERGWTFDKRALRDPQERGGGLGSRQLTRPMPTDDASCADDLHRWYADAAQHVVFSQSPTGGRSPSQTLLITRDPLPVSTS
jgi:hypothetical protein